LSENQRFNSSSRWRGFAFLASSAADSPVFAVPSPFYALHANPFARLPRLHERLAVKKSGRPRPRSARSDCGGKKTAKNGRFEQGGVRRDGSS